MDDKTIYGATTTATLGSKLHIVSAFCNKNEISLGQLTIGEKTNEITAIPKLLDLIAVQGCIITIDATGCQKDIAKKKLNVKQIISCKSKTIKKGCENRSKIPLKPYPCKPPTQK